MIWKFSDGTMVGLGGTVLGASAFAAELREHVLNARIYPHAPPCSMIDVDPRNAAQLDCWLTERLDIAVRIDKLDLKLERPEHVPPMPAPPWTDAPPAPKNAVF